MQDVWLKLWTYDGNLFSVKHVRESDPFAHTDDKAKMQLFMKLECIMSEKYLYSNQ